jgi:hypothetical protein
MINKNERTGVEKVTQMPNHRIGLFRKCSKWALVVFAFLIQEIMLGYDSSFIGADTIQIRLYLLKEVIYLS